MKITDVSVTLWEWKDIPPTRYTKTVASSGTRSTQMGLLRIRTDDGIEGNGFSAPQWDLHATMRLMWLMPLRKC